MVKKELIESIAEKFKIIGPLLNEKNRRVWAATEAYTIGRGGLMIVAAATGLSRATICEGIKTKLGERSEIIFPRIRDQGGGRKSLKTRDPLLVAKLDALVDPTSRGDPESPLR